MIICFWSPIRVNPHCGVGRWLAVVWPKHRGGESSFYLSLWRQQNWLVFTISAATFWQIQLDIYIYIYIYIFPGLPGVLSFRNRTTSDHPKKIHRLPEIPIYIYNEELEIQRCSHEPVRNTDWSTLNEKHICREWESNPRSLDYSQYFVLARDYIVGFPMHKHKHKIWWFHVVVMLRVLHDYFSSLRWFPSIALRILFCA